MSFAVAAAGFSPLASNRPPLVRHTSATAVRTHSPQLLLPELPLSLLTDIDAFSDIDAYASGAEQVRDGLAAGDAIGIFILLSITGILAIIGTDDDTISLPGDPLPSSSTATPGWLTCDMRVPLPEYQDLLEACHLLNTLDGARWWLCATPDDYESCQPSKDFSDYYKTSVYVCQAN